MVVALVMQSYQETHKLKFKANKRQIKTLRQLDGDGDKSENNKGKDSKNNKKSSKSKNNSNDKGEKPAVLQVQEVGKPHS